MKNIHNMDPDELELPHRTDLIEQACKRRIYHPPLFGSLMADRAMVVTVNSKKSKGTLRMRFHLGDKVAQECTLDTASMIAIDAAAGTEWVWQGPGEGGVCLIVAHAVELLEIVALDLRLCSHLGLVIAGVSPQDIPSLISAQIIKNVLLIAQSRGASQRASK
jgi:hypothetical protein